MKYRTSQSVRSRRILLATSFLAVTLAVTSSVLFATQPAPVDAQSTACDIKVAIYESNLGYKTSTSSGDDFTTLLDQNVTPSGETICSTLIPSGSWPSTDFLMFDVLWIGHDTCWGTDSADFDNVALGAWEPLIDPSNVMIAGGDFDLHYVWESPGPTKVVHAMLEELSDSADPDKVGVVLQAGCYRTNHWSSKSLAGDWLDKLGGSFTGLSHKNWMSGDPRTNGSGADPKDDIYDHQFNVDFGLEEAATWKFGAACHGGVQIQLGSLVDTTYNLQPIFRAWNNTVNEIGDCFYMSDESKPPVGSVPCSSIDVYFLIDDSGSVTSAEVSAFADLANQIQASIDDVLPDARYGVARYGGLSQTETVLFIEHDLSGNPVPVSPTRQVPFTSDDHLADAVRAFQKSLFGVPAELQVLPANPSSYDRFTGFDEDVPQHLVILSDGKWDETDESTMKDQANPGQDFLAYNALKDMQDFEISLVLDETDDPGTMSQRASIPSMGGSWMGTTANGTPDPRQLYLKADHSPVQIATDIIGNLANCRETVRSTDPAK